MGPEEQPEEIGYHRREALRRIGRLDLWQMAEDQNRRLVLAEKELAEVRDQLQAVMDRFPIPGDHLGGGIGC
jgi:hypothetical protein